ncbi:MAG: FAD-binding oxidoreductase, partial [Kiritimatiellae bacterium]|nr:FAD-binding oxidoreductase [Kiritimatiellia bacterium]
MKIKTDSYMFEMIRTELTDAVGDANVDVKFADKFGHSIDYYWIPEMWHDRGKECPKADFIVHPGSTEEVAKVMKIANQYKIPVVPWGGGSGSQGGALPIYGGIILDMKRMNRFYGVDREAYTVRCQTGIIARHLEWNCNKEGFSTMHLPASISCATIGGFLAHRGTGVLSTKYGKIEDMVMSLEVVTPTGEVIRTLPVPRHASGPDLTMLFLGSEGTLGVITEVTLKVHPQPEAREFRAYIFKDFHTAMQAGATLMRSRLGPCAMRLYDETETKTHVSKVFGINLDKGAYLVFGFDGRKDIVANQMKYAREIMEKQFKGKDLGAKGGEWWWENKYKFFYPGYMFHVPQAFGTLDTVADFSHIENVYWAMKNVVNKEFPDARFIGHFSHWYEWG